MNDLQAQGEAFTYHHAAYEGGQHWFSAEDAGDEVGYAHVIERRGPSGPHVEIRKLWINPHYRGQGIGSRLLDDVGQHFKGHELRLKPYPIDEDGGQDERDLRRYYSNRGFGDYQLRKGDPLWLYDYMTKRAQAATASKDDGGSPAAARQNTVEFPGPCPAQPPAPVPARNEVSRRQRHVPSAGQGTASPRRAGR